MMFYEGLVAAIKVGEKVLRERNSEVYLPFGSEYKICLKNTTQKNALIDIKIDGQKIGPSLILDKYSSIDLERFTKDSLNKGYKFKFIEKTEEISNYRGNRISDGLIEIEYDFERENIYKCQNYPFDYNLNDYKRESWKNKSYPKDLNEFYENSGTFCSLCSSENSNRNTQGITTEGSFSHQSFQNASIGALEGNKKYIVFYLKGGKFEEPITTKHKLVCSICGLNNSFKSNYCSKCGSNLQII